MTAMRAWLTLSTFNKYFTSVGRLTAFKANQLAKDHNWSLDLNAYTSYGIL